MARARTPLPVPLKRLIQVLAVIFVFYYFVLPQLPKVRGALPLLGRVNLWLVALAVLLEACSILSYTNFIKAIIPKDKAPKYLVLLRMQLSTFAVSHVIPGGSAVGGALGY